MDRKFGVQTSTQAPEAVSVMSFDLKLPGQLPVHSFDDLTNRIEEATYFGRDLLLLVGSRQGQQTNATVLE